MLLNGQDHGVLARLEGVVFDTLDDVDESDPRGEGVAVVDDRLPVCTVPAVH